MRSGRTWLLNTCSHLLIVNFSVFVACWKGSRCTHFEKVLYIFSLKILTKFLNGLIHYFAKSGYLRSFVSMFSSNAHIFFMLPSSVREVEELYYGLSCSFLLYIKKTLVRRSLENRSFRVILRGVAVQNEQIWRSMTFGSIVVVVLLLSLPWRVFIMDKSRNIR